jgi:hypothetical protein
MIIAAVPSPPLLRSAACPRPRTAPKKPPRASLLSGSMVDDASTGELKHQQEVKEHVEREGVADAVNAADAAAHRRRAEKAAYLQEKLAERERAEDEDEDEDEAPDDHS